ncbi:metal-dependent transcriptional regulator [Macrococcus animalis]|uniref:metal-dependent transcriptional regulator n=1 Tax=Macrococcus animalis TaxID=3395467 RepID=UPI0039BEAC68
MTLKKISEEKEDYLKVLLSTGGDDHHISNKIIANKLNVKPPSVTEMMSKLQKEDLVSYTAYKGYKLTKEGLDYTLVIVQRHRLIESFLIKVLKYTWEEVHNEAEILEHKVSDLFIEKIDQLMNYPKYCPHGGLIPRNGVYKEHHTESLVGFNAGDKVIIKRVEDEPSLLSILTHQDLSIGSEVKIIKKSEHANEIVIDNGKINIKLDTTQAHFIFCVLSE